MWAQTPDVTPEDWERINRLIIAGQPTVRERVDMGLLIGSLSMSSMALGLTMSCTTAKTCQELNPVMAKFLDDGPIDAVVFKSAVNGALHYAAWRTTKGKTRTWLMAALFAVNTFDALHDIREMRQINGRLGR